MRLNRLSAVALVVVLGVLSITRAQQPAANVLQLEEEIASLSVMDRDPTTQPEIRKLNRSFLDERKNRLRLLLEERIAALQTYRRLVSLTPTESRTLDESIRKVEKELLNLQDENYVGRAADSDSAINDVRVTGSSVPANVPALPVSGEPSKKKQKPKGEPDVTTIQVNQEWGALPSAIADIKEDDCFDPEMAKLIEGTVGHDEPLKDKDYCLIHLAKWKQTKVGTKSKVVKNAATQQDETIAVDVNKYAIAKDGWFLYKRVPSKPVKGCTTTGETTTIWERQTDDDGKRIYGYQRVAVLMVHIGVPRDIGEDVTYKVAINKRTPAPFKNLMTLVGALSGGNSAGTKATGDVAPTPTTNLWGGKLLAVENVPSDMVVSSSVAVQDQQSQEFTRTYQNEGKYFWDVSVGVPVKTIRELQFASEGNRVSAAGKERQDVYGFLNIYYPKVDVSTDKLAVLPHFMFGVPLASKPLQHPFAGIGYGVYKTPIKFDLFAGVIFNRERVPRTLTTGSTATPSQLDADLQTRWVRKFTWGISFPVSQIEKAIKK